MAQVGRAQAPMLRPGGARTQLDGPVSVHPTHANVSDDNQAKPATILAMLDVFAPLHNCVRRSPQLLLWTARFIIDLAGRRQHLARHLLVVGGANAAQQPKLKWAFTWGAISTHIFCCKQQQQQPLLPLQSTSSFLLSRRASGPIGETICCTARPWLGGAVAAPSE